MPITSPPTAPSRNDPATFATRADAFVAWLVSAVPEFNELALATGPGLFLNGTAGAPSISFANDTDSGFWRIGANIIGGGVNGAEVFRVTTAGMQVTGLLTGTAVTQTADDTTAGRLLKFADWGIGSSAGVTVTDANAVIRNGWYSFGSGATNIPVVSAGALFVMTRATGAITQLATFQGSAVNRAFLRTSTDSGATWTAWERVVTFANTLSTVSQSGGLPTGGLIERGSNANGEFVRFADGTQICTATVTTSLAIDVAGHFGGFRTGLQSWTYPAFFAAAPTLSVTPSAVTAFSGSAGTIGIGSAQWILNAVTTTASASRTVSLLAIGRWF